MTQSPTPVTPERIGEILDGEGIAYDIMGDTVIVTYPQFGIYFGCFEQALGAAGTWTGAVGPELVTVALGASNEWNLTQLTPMLGFSIVGPDAEATPTDDHAPAAEDIINFSFRRTALTGEGMSRNQLGAWIMTTIETTVACVGWLETQFPDTTTTILGGEYLPLSAMQEDK
ncbi:hypothetical protein [Corynebacterium aquilae]|uniref:Uncharacterized protein n=1 Tax=Corynebacterium aquilae DSM 44791 TaxID=1431546 RepID=A0A1L7CGE2_9CORY|nr:hypothetical protein [Corynebacterium aquilae]APT84843.1 hypothetical protein CAQU_06910 [Corynebacterium aquilae DSM 44791]